MRVVYLLGVPELSGGVKVVFQHASLLQAAGYDVTVAAQGAKPAWAPFHGRYLNLRKDELAPGDALVIATYWTTVKQALRLTARVVHFCQGFEGALPHLEKQWPRIEAVYRLRLPTLVVSPHLDQLLSERYRRDCRLVQPPLDHNFVPAATTPDRNPDIVNVFIQGIFECDWKGVGAALEAVRIMRAQGRRCRVLRASLLPLSTAERELLEPDLFLTCADPAVVAETLRGSDICLYPSHRIEGFGLPMLEAMACRIPVVGSDTPSIRHMTQGRLALIPGQEPLGFAGQAMRLLDDPVYRDTAIETGYRLSQNFAPQRIARQLTAALEWASREV